MLLFPVGDKRCAGSITDVDRANLVQIVLVQIAINREGYQRLGPDHRHA